MLFRSARLPLSLDFSCSVGKTILPSSFLGSLEIGNCIMGLATSSPQRAHSSVSRAGARQGRSSDARNSPRGARPRHGSPSRSCDEEISSTTAQRNGRRASSRRRSHRVSLRERPRRSDFGGADFSSTAAQHNGRFGDRYYTTR